MAIKVRPKLPDKIWGGAGKIWGAVPPGPNVEPQLDRAITIGCRLSVVCNVLYCDETIRPSEKLSEGANTNLPTAFSVVPSPTPTGTSSPKIGAFYFGAYRSATLARAGLLLSYILYCFVIGYLLMVAKNFSAYNPPCLFVLYLTGV